MFIPFPSPSVLLGRGVRRYLHVIREGARRRLAVRVHAAAGRKPALAAGAGGLVAMDLAHAHEVSLLLRRKALLGVLYFVLLLRLGVTRRSREDCYGSCVTECDCSPLTAGCMRIERLP